MSRWLLALSFGGSILAAFGCNDETVELVDKEVCYSGMRWVGDKRGSPEMFPGRDCVGCHIDNDGPPLALGGTIYPYVVSTDVWLASQSGEDCFGREGVDVFIEDAEGQTVQVTTNRAGNFYVEGNPDDFAKPFNVRITWINGLDGEERTNQMFTEPSYGGCGRCHNPTAERFPPPDAEEGAFTPDLTVSPIARIGTVGYGPGADGFNTVQAELEAIAAENGLPAEDD